MIPIEKWRLVYDVDNRAGCIDLYPVGAPPAAAPIRLAPLAGEDFAACCAVLAAARAVGGRPAFDPSARTIIF